ncbi:MAG: hypothetical protein ACLU99_13845 [Alphaproteobacteria bacterium]
MAAVQKVRHLVHKINRIWKELKIAPRPGYMGELEKIGFVFHKEYWLENAYYRFSAKEVERARTGHKQLLSNVLQRG